MAVNLTEALIKASRSDDEALIRELVDEIRKLRQLQKSDEAILAAAMAELEYATARAAKLQKQNNELRDLMIEATKSGIDIPIEALTRS
jgi:transcription termination factor NusB